MWPSSRTFLVAGRPLAAGPRGRAGCVSERAGPVRRRLAGQSIMTGMDGRVPSSGLLERIRGGEVGGVILFGFNIGSTSALARLTAELQAAAAAGGNPPLLIAVDQEGGAVRRLPAGPPDLSPAAMGREGSAGQAGSEGSCDRRVSEAIRRRRRSRPGARYAGLAVELPRQPRVQPQPAAECGARDGLRRGPAARRRRGDCQALPGARNGARVDRHEPCAARDVEARSRRAAAPVRAGDRRRREARDGQQCRLHRLRPGRRAGRPLAADRHRPAAEDSSASGAW